jgi:hypothetical protein
MNHDRIHARAPKTDLESWQQGRLTALTERDGHAVFTVTPTESQSGGKAGENETVELTVTHAVRDLVVSRLDTDSVEDAIGELVWFRRRGGA